MRFRSVAAATVLAAKHLASRIEEWWFDRTRKVHTRGATRLEGLRICGDASHCYEYLPSRAATARIAIRKLPIRDYADYTFVDIGAGKGRVLFLAAEYPFRRIEGVEFAWELCSSARENIAAFLSTKRKCPPIGCVNMNAINYSFPAGNLVLYFFNPFSAEVMDTVMANLEASLDAHPRDVLLVLAFPEFAPAMHTHRRFQIIEHTRRHLIYRARPAPIQD